MTDGADPADPAALPAEIPVCYRHPEREAHIRCNRCERFICPDDMISAAVGFQCPECVREGSKGVRQPRTFAGASVRGDTGVVTLAIIAINVVVWLAVQGSDSLLRRLVLQPFAYPTDSGGVASGEWYRLVTAAFLHQEALHITMNMLLLYLVGRPLEAMLGRSRYIATYLICALGGSTASYLFMSPYSGSLGASGAVFGLVGALIVVDRQARANPTGTLINVAILLLPGFLFANIDWRGHVGGLLVGSLLGLLYLKAPRANRALWHWGGAALITVALLVAVQLRTEHLKDELHSLFFGSAPATSSLVVPNGDNSCGELHACNSADQG